MGSGGFLRKVTVEGSRDQREAVLRTAAATSADDLQG